MKKFIALFLSITICFSMSSVALCVTSEALPDLRPEVQATITGHEIVGNFANAQATSATVGPQKSYDDDVSTKWNPNANFADSANAGIVYTLDDFYNITSLVLTYTGRVYYFDAYVSADNTNWTQVGPSVRSNNYTDVYTGYVATIDGLDTESACYVKIIFKGGASTFVNLNEVEVFGKTVPDETDSRPVVQSSVTAHKIVGGYTDAVASSATVGPQKSYDGDKSSRWNPNARFADTAEAGIVYTLDDYYNITSIVLTFGTREYYFDLYVSVDNLSWTQIGPSVRSNNYTSVYTDKVATVDGLDTVSARYVKLVFKGSKDGVTFINLFEVEIFGKVVPSVQAPITAHEIVGNFANAQATSATVGPQNSYDGDKSSRWNPNANYNESANAGIIYTLDGSYNVTSLVLTFGSREYYFDAYVSADGTSWTKVGPSVRSSNYTDVYSGYVATIDGLDTEGAGYVKIIFKGAKDNSTYVNLFEVEVFGRVNDRASEPAITETPEITVENIKCAITSSYYDRGTIGIGTDLAEFTDELDERLAIIEYGTVFFSRKMLGEAELVIGFENANGQQALTVSKSIAGEVVPESFVAVLKDKNDQSGAGTVSNGYYNTTYVARSFVKCYNAETRTTTIVYGNIVSVKGADMFPGVVL